MSEIIRKITIASTGWTKAQINAALAAVGGNDGDKVDLMKIVGITTSAKPGQTDKGEFVVLHGQFTAINCDGGEVFTSAKCILPNFISESLSVALEQSPEVEFAILIGAEAKASAVTGYQFTVKPLVESKPSDKMAALLAIASAAPTQTQKALDAPAKKAAKAK